MVFATKLPAYTLAVCAVILPLVVKLLNVPTLVILVCELVAIAPYIPVLATNLEAYTFAVCAVMLPLAAINPLAIMLFAYSV